MPCDLYATRIFSCTYWVLGLALAHDAPYTFTARA